MTPYLQIPCLVKMHPVVRKCFLSLFVTMISIFSLECNAQTCKTVPNHFNTYEEAIKWVKKTRFKISEDLNTSRSSFIESAHYYSCDGNTGYFIIKIKDTEYIYADMPIGVWKGFKGSSSFGTFYNLNIRNKYQLRVG